MFSTFKIAQMFAMLSYNFNINLNVQVELHVKVLQGK